MKDILRSKATMKVIATLILLAIIVNTYTAVKSLWYSSFDANWGDRFIYENIATCFGFASIFLTFILSTLQKHVYWATSKITVRLDAKQAQARREIFEASYRIGAVLVLIAAWVFATTIHNIPAIIANAQGTVPGHLFWLPFNLALVFFALPLVLAAWKKRQVL